MKKPIFSMLACLGLTLLIQTGLSATVVQKSGFFGGIKMDYLLCLPKNWVASKEYPTILAFCGAEQDLATAQYTMQANWQAEAEKRGYVIIMPVAPNGQLFFEGGERIFPDFLDRMKSEHRLSGGKLHVAGRSNGGVSAFHVAIAFPEYFQSVTVYPGFVTDEDMNHADRLKGIPVKMACGQLDAEWLQYGRIQSAQLSAMGIRAWLQVETGCNHGIESFTGSGSARLFELVEKKR
jgi:poly(3-hydroxybutyrate) depolymerase